MAEQTALQFQWTGANKITIADFIHRTLALGSFRMQTTPSPLKLEIPADFPHLYGEI